MKYSERAKT